MSLRSAAECAAGYLGIYALAGLVLVPIVSGIAGSSEIGDLTGIYVIAHFLSAAALWLPATVTVLLLEKWIGPAPWRRLWLTGVLAVPVVWIGTLVCAQLAIPLFHGMQLAFGWWAGILIYFAWAVLFSNLLLLMTWVIPSRTTRSRAA